MTWRRGVPAAVACALAAACGGDQATAPPVTNAIVVTVRGLVPLDPLTQGRYEVWSVAAGGTTNSLGTFAVTGTQETTVSFSPPAGGDPTAVLVTVQPLQAAAGTPSPHVVLRGDWRNGRATLAIEGALTVGGFPLREQPGQFTMFSPSDNHMNGYPSFEECGVWLFNMAPRQTPQNDMWVRLALLTAGWTYEGWMVRDHGAPDAIWLSYGKFLPDVSGAVTTRDDTGWGPFSGVLDFETAGEEDFPGDDWFSNPLGFPFPSVLTLPLDLREKNTQGVGRWTHVITIEPMSDKGEPIGSERPFAVRPYRDPFGDGGPGVPRTITFHPDGVPRGEAKRQ